MTRTGSDTKGNWEDHTPWPPFTRRRDLRILPKLHTGNYRNYSILSKLLREILTASLIEYRTKPNIVSSIDSLNNNRDD